jgi:uncharacterized membrane protein
MDARMSTRMSARMRGRLMRRWLGLSWSLRGRLAWARVRDSLWFIPALCTAGAAALAAATVRVQVLEVVPTALRRELLFGGGAEGARGVLSAIAGSLITVTGTVFSVTIVALQLSGSQYTPRVVRSFLADRPNQIVLGIFIGTFTYALLVLRTIHGASDGVPAFVPAFAVTVSVALVLVAIGALIFFINHAARSIQVSVILDRETARTKQRIEEVFPETLDDPTGREAHDPPRGVPRVPTPPADTRVHEVDATEGGYIQAVHVRSLVGAAERAGVTVRLTRRVGEFVIAGETVAEAWPAERCTAPLARAVRQAVLLGAERTPEQDPEFGIIEISDIAVRAMSAAINDPTTAMQCVDRLAELLTHLARRRVPAPPVAGRSGVPRYVPLGTTFDRALGLAFDQLRYSASGNPAVMRKLVDTIARLRELAPPRYHAALEAHLDAVVRATRHEMPNPADQGAVRELADRRMREVADDEAFDTSRRGRLGA